jgi:ElaB/YqjD/DUF883 family membrane-anchored ribosome-binding protein
MSDPLPEDPNGPALPESEASSPVSPPLQGTAPAWDDEPGFATPSQEQLVLEARARQALREAALRNDAATSNANSPLDDDPLGPLESPRFKVERGGRNAMAETAEKIGSAVGSAQREVRRRLELVRRPTSPLEMPSASAADLAERSARMMQEIDADVADVRRQAARKMEDWSEQAEERLLEFRQRARAVLRRSTLRAQELAETYPLQAIAAVAGTFFIIGIALRLSRRSHRG